MANNPYVNKVAFGGNTLIDLSGDNVAAADVVSGKKFHLPSGAQGTGAMSSKAAATYNTSTSNQTIAAGQYLSGAQTIRGVKVTNLSAENIKSGVTVQVGDAGSAGRVASVTGTLEAYDSQDIVSFGVSWKNNYYINDSGVSKASAAYKHTNTYIPIEPGKTYSIRIRKFRPVAAAVVIASYDSTKTFIRRDTAIASTSSTGVLTGSFTTPSNAAFIRLNVAGDHEKYPISTDQIEIS